MTGSKDVAPPAPGRQEWAEKLSLPPEGAPVPLRRQLRVLAHGVAPRRRARPYLIYGQGRTGSTLLGSLLASHPTVTFGNEVLRGPVHAPLRYVEGLRAIAAPHTYGCHVKPYHLTNSQGITDTAGWLRRAQGQGWLVVHLRRDDTLRHVLSNMSRNANATSHFHEGDGRRITRLHVDPDQLLEWMEIRSHVMTQELADLKGLDHLSVSYEQDLLPGGQAWSAVSELIFDALDIPRHAVATTLRKINHGSLEDLVVNHEAVADAVRASRWKHLLDQ